MGARARTIGFVGLGAMGRPMAVNLLGAGFALVVHDVSRAAAVTLEGAGALWADSPADLAGRCDVICTCLPDLDGIENVAIGPSGLIDGVRPGQTVIDLSTSSIALAERLLAAFSERDVAFLQAPVSGGATGARRRRLAFWVGGEEAVFAAQQDVFLAMGDRTMHLGGIAAGLTTKLVNNCLSQTMQAAIGEVFVLGVKAGVEPLRLWEAIRQGSPGRRRTFDGMIDQYLPGRYDDPHAALRIIAKDMHLATDLAADLGVEMPIAAIAQRDIERARARGWDDRDCRSVMLLPQERAGVRIAADPAAIAAILAADPAATTDPKHGVEDD